MLLALAVHIRKLSISNHCEANRLVIVRQQRSEVQMRKLIIGTPVIRMHYLTWFINSVISSGCTAHHHVSEMKRWKKLLRSYYKQEDGDGASKTNSCNVYIL